MRAFCALMLLLAIFAGCGEEAGPTGPAKEEPESGLVYGTVVDQATGKPVPGVVLQLGDMTTTAGGDGSFRLPEIPFGQGLELKVETNGYEPYKQVFDLDTTQFEIRVELIAEADPLKDLQALLDALQANIESDDPANIPTIQTFFAEDYSVPLDDPATMFAIQFAPIPVDFPDIEPSMTELFQEYNNIAFALQERNFDIPNANEASVFLVLHLHTEHGPRPDIDELDVRCELRFRRGDDGWQIVYWRLIELAQQPAN